MEDIIADLEGKVKDLEYNISKLEIENDSLKERIENALYYLK